MKENRSETISIRVTPTLKRLIVEDGEAHRWDPSTTAYYRLEEAYEQMRRKKNQIRVG